VKLCRVGGQGALASPEYPLRVDRRGAPVLHRSTIAVARPRRSPATANPYFAALFFLVPEPGALPIFAASGWPSHVPYEKQRMQVKV